VKLPADPLRRAGLRALGLVVLLAVLVVVMPATEPFFHWAFPSLARPVYDRATFAALTLSHIGLVGAASLVVVIAGVAVGIGVTRPAGREFAGIVGTVTAIGQTFPPVAILAIAVPMIGFGAGPTIIALIAYGILPVLDNTVAGLRSVPASARDASDGMGLTATQKLFSVELPLAAPVIVAGIRTSVTISIGTATIGSTVGALTLGSPIIEGLSGSNTAYVVQGAILVGLLAIAVDQLFAWLDLRLRRHEPGPG
jgi:osmoprotectant transport system permease protein